MVFNIIQKAAALWINYERERCEKGNQAMVLPLYRWLRWWFGSGTHCQLEATPPPCWSSLLLLYYLLHPSRILSPMSPPMILSGLTLSGLRVPSPLRVSFPHLYSLQETEQLMLNICFDFLALLVKGQLCGSCLNAGYDGRQVWPSAFLREAGRMEERGNAVRTTARSISHDI